MNGEIFDIILENTLAGYWDLNIPENTEYLSPRLKKMFGYEDHELPNVPETRMQLILPDDLPMVRDSFDAHVKSKGKVIYENTIRYLHKDGSIVYVLCKGQVIEWAEDGSPIRMVGSHVNVTDILADAKKFKEKDETLDLIITGINAGIWNWDIPTGKEWWTDTFYKLLGYTKDEIEATYDTFLNKLLHPGDKEKVENAVSSHLRDHKPYKLNIRLKTGRGTYRWFETSGQAKWNYKGEAIRMAGSIIDVNDNKVKEIHLQDSNKLITDQNSRLVNFAHIVSHNLRSFSGTLESMVNLWEISNNEERETLIENIGDISTRLSQTIDYLSEVVSINTRAKVFKKRIRISEQLNNVLKIVSTEVEQKEAEIITDFSQCDEIEYVPAYLESILLNFVTNGIKYKHPDRKPVLNISARYHDERPLVTIQDNGLGIDLNRYGHKLFGMYKTFHGNADAKGIGLFMTKNQVESLDGKIEVESEVNKGTTFKVYL